jgi:catechol 2,3-dioxygenase-like lactoylglutathione lyase family enzyme
LKGESIVITGMPRIAIAVRDFPSTVATFRDKLGMPVIDLSATSVDDLGAKLAMCTPSGGSNIEIMSPADPASPLSQSLERFLDRRGEGLFALMLEAPDPNAEAEELAERGLKVLPLMAGAGGRDVHPSSTHGVLVRVYPVDSFTRPHSADQSDESGAAALSGIARVIIAVHDVDQAVTVYRTRFAMAADEVILDPARGVRSATCRPATGGSIELVSVADTARPFAQSIQAFLDADREGMYALVLQSPDLQACADALSGHGLPVARAADSNDVLEIDRGSMSGALFRIEESN